jgi:hypothetical protein
MALTASRTKYSNFYMPAQGAHLPAYFPQVERGFSHTLNAANLADATIGS